MNQDKKKLYIVSVILLIIFSLVIFIPSKLTRVILSVALIPITIGVCQLIKKRSTLLITKKEVFLITLVSGLLYVMIYYLSGLFYGFYRNSIPFNIETILLWVIPTSLIIITNEIIRSVLLMQKNKFASVVSYVISILMESLLFYNLWNISTFNYFMDFVGLTLLPAITWNILYHYLSSRYGAKPNIAIRLIITLYPFIIPVIPQTPESLVAFFKLLIPLLIYLFIDLLYEKKKKFTKSKSNKLALVSTGVMICLMISFVMLISCQFKYCAIVVATESMTGEINKGDLVIYERYEDQPITKGQVIVFEKDDSTIIHRVVDIENINGENRYYTKGDANEDIDLGFIVATQIVGVTNFKISYLGYPTLWIRDLFSK